MEAAKVRTRPLRLAFLVEARDKKSLMQIIEINSALWGGIYNIIIPVFKSLPNKYRDRPFKSPPVKSVLQGLVDTFQPDFLIETKEDQSKAFGIEFPEKRTGSIQELLSRDERDRAQFGIDLRSICDELYNETFRFVQRHPQNVIIPSCNDSKYALLFAAMFGTLPEKGPFSDIAEVFIDELDGKRTSFDPLDYLKVFDRKNLYPLRVTAERLRTHRWGAYREPQILFLDEGSTLDIIDFWNYRALGWLVRPLPASLAPKLTRQFEDLIAANRKAAVVSKRWDMTQFICGERETVESVQAYIRTLKLPADQAISTASHGPRLWDEFGRSADDALPQIVTHANKTVDVSIIGNGLHFDIVPHEFADDDLACAKTLASANVIESVSQGAPVIPWSPAVASKLTYDFGDEKTWISREGIVAFAGDFSSRGYMRLPDAKNIFRALVESAGFDFSQSIPGRICEKIISSVGGLKMTGLFARSIEVLRFLDRMASQELEVELPLEDDKRTKVKKEFSPQSEATAAMMRANEGKQDIADIHLKALVRLKILKQGLALKCPECTQTSWFSIEGLTPNLTCPKCFGEFPFPEGAPPKGSWAYRVAGPFASTGYAKGSYCVATALHFLDDKIGTRSTWITSFELLKNGKKEHEVDFGLLVQPSPSSHRSEPYLILGECKSFDVFKQEEFQKAAKLAKLFPGAVLAFCTFRDELSPNEKKELAKLARAGRTKTASGKQSNPVLILTSMELIGQYRLGLFESLYPKHERLVRSLYFQGDLVQICELTQTLYLGIKTSHEVRMERRKKVSERRMAKQASPAI